MAGSGTNQTIGQSLSQQTLPGWENAGYQNIASQAFGQAFNPTTGLPNGSPANQTVADQTGNFSNYLNQANAAPTMGNGLKNNLEGYTPNVGFTPTSTGTWNSAAAQQYMNPYTENVLQTQEKLAHDTYGQQKAALDQQAAASGALGGDRNAVAQSGLDNDFALQEQNLQANALNSAYQNAQSAFNNDQNRSLQSDVTNSQLGLAAGIQNAELNYGARAASNQFELGQGGLNLQGLSHAGQAAQLAQNYAQSRNDTDYQNAMMNYLFPEQQISYAQGILNGTPQQWTNQTDYFLPAGNPYSQALGAAAAQNKPNISGGGGAGGGSGAGSKPGPGQKPGQKPGPGNTLNNPPNLNLPWNTEPDTSGVFTQTPTAPGYQEQQQIDANVQYDPSQFTPAFDPSSLGVYQNANSVDSFGNLIPTLPNGLQGPSWYSDPSSVVGQLNGGDLANLAPSWDGHNSGAPAYDQWQNAYAGFGSPLTPDEWDSYGGDLQNPYYYV